MEFINSNEIFKGDFDQMVSFKNLEVFTEEMMNQNFQPLKDNLEKAESFDVLEEEDKEFSKAIIEEIGSFQQFTVLSEKDGKISRTKVFVREPQVEWEGEIVKGEFGEITDIKNCGGIYLDTPLNRKLKRVGEQYSE